MFWHQPLYGLNDSAVSKPHSYRNVLRGCCGKTLKSIHVCPSNPQCSGFIQGSSEDRAPVQLIQQSYSRLQWSGSPVIAGMAAPEDAAQKSHTETEPPEPDSAALADQALTAHIVSGSEGQEQEMGTCLALTVMPMGVPGGDDSVPALASARRLGRAGRQQGAYFRTGEALHAYEYYATEMETNNEPVYRCIRGKASSSHTRLYLYKSFDGHWIATEAGIDSVNPVNEGTPAFRTAKPVEDITEPANKVPWQWWDEVQHVWKGEMKFNTYGILVAPEPPTSS